MVPSRVIYTLFERIVVMVSNVMRVDALKWKRGREIDMFVGRDLWARICGQKGQAVFEEKRQRKEKRF